MRMMSMDANESRMARPSSLQGKKLLCWLMAFLFAFAMMPTSALAMQESDSTSESADVGSVPTENEETSSSVVEEQESAKKPAIALEQTSLDSIEREAADQDVAVEVQDSSDPSELSISFGDCIEIGTYDDETAYYYDGRAATEARSVVFADLADLMGEDSMIAAMESNSMVFATNEAPIDAGFATNTEKIEKDGSWAFTGGYTAASFEGELYAYWIMDDNYSMYYVIVSMAAAPEPAPLVAPTFICKAGETEIAGDSIAKTEGGFQYSGMVYDPTNPDADNYGYVYPKLTCDLYTITLPADTTTVDFVFSEACLAYGYDDDAVTCTEGMDEYEGGFVGATTASRSVDKDGDGKADFVTVQSPYDASWNTTTFYAVTFVLTAQTIPDGTEEAAKGYEETGAKLAASDPSTYGDWTVLGLARSERTDLEGKFDSYIERTCQSVADKKGVLNANNSTATSRVIIGLSAVGYDVTDVAGYNLLECLADYNKATKPALTGAAYALLALDSGAYEIPQVSEGGVQTTREGLVEHVLSKQLDDAGWAYSGKSIDPDATAIAIQALAPYRSTNADVATAIDRALERLSAIQRTDGVFASWGTPNAESCAQVLIALCTLGIDPATDERFIKDEGTLLSALSSFAVEGGGFSHTAGGAYNKMATEQCYYALVAYDRMKAGKTSLFDMTDVIKRDPSEDPKPDDPKPEDPDPEGPNPEDPTPVPTPDPGSNGQTPLQPNDRVNGRGSSSLGGFTRTLVASGTDLPAAANGMDAAALATNASDDEIVADKRLSDEDKTPLSEGTATVFPWWWLVVALIGVAGITALIVVKRRGHVE